MPAFLLPVAAGLGGSILGTAVSSVAGSMVGAELGPALEPRKRQNLYNANAASADSKNVYPTLDALINSYWRNIANRTDITKVAAKLGCDLSASFAINPGEMTLQQWAWRTILETSQPRIPTEMIASAWAMGRINREEFSKQFAISGIFNQQWLDTWEDRLWVPDYTTAYTQKLIGTITADELENIAKRNGMYRIQDGELLKRFSSPIAPQEAIELRIRDRIDDSGLGRLLAASGIRHPPSIEAYSTLAKDRTIPPISDLIRFAVKEVFTPDLAAYLGLFEEFPQAILPFAKRQGIGENVDGLVQPLTLPRELAEQVGFPIATQEASWSHYYWAAHWQPVAPSQAYQMLHRLRPDSVGRYRAMGINVNPFSIDDVRRWLRIADYPPRIREQLAAISYRPMRLFDIRRAVALGTLTDPQAIGRYLDLGYDQQTAEDSLRLVKAGEADKQRGYIKKLVESSRRRTILSVLRGFRNGLIDRPLAETQLQDYGATPNEAKQLLDQERADFLHETIDAQVKSVRSSYFSGALSGIEAEIALRGIGLIPGRVQDYMNRWITQRTLPRRSVTVEKVLNWLSQGIIDVSMAQTRLANLGLAQSDILVSVIEANRKGEQIRAKTLIASDQEAKKRAAALAKVRQDAIKNVRGIENEIKRITPVAKLQSWKKKGIITDNYFLNRMRSAGYPDDIARAYLEETNASSPTVSRTTNGQQE